MEEKKPERPGRQLDPRSLQKLDGGLRHLLSMTHEETLAAVERHKNRQKERLAQLREMIEAVEKADTEEDVTEARHLIHLVRTALHTRSIYDSLSIEGAAPVIIKAEANVQFLGNRDDLLALGLEVRSHAQDIFVVVGTPSQLAALAVQPATIRLQSPLPEGPTVEDAAQQAEIDQAHAAWPGTPAGYHGDGVIIGIIDSPLDLTHPCFRQNSASHDTRVRYMWVQQPSMLVGGVAQPATPHASQQSPADFHSSNPGSPDFTGLNYGIAYTETDINTALGAVGGTYGTGANQICCEPEATEHGTHVAGIAAGDGADSTWATSAHVGVADQATIVYVSNLTWDSARIQDALSFIFAIADDLNMPVAVNISLGGNWGPHVGNMPRDLFIDNSLNDFDERVVVGTSGNNNRLGDPLGRGDGFRTRTIPDGNTDLFTMISTNPSPAGHDVSLEIWYTGPELHFRVSMAGAATTPAGTFTGVGSGFHGILGTYDVDIWRAHDIEADMRQVRLDVVGARAADPVTVELHNPAGGGDVTYYAWVCSQAQLANLTGASNDRWTLNANSCCKSILSVGACEKLAVPAPAAGEQITDYSGAGPTIDGRIKPEIVAVGGTSTRPITSADSTRGIDWTTMSGTSMAAPLVTGATALLMEAARLQGYSPNHDAVKALLVQNTNRLSLHLNPALADFAETERNLYGNGRLRLLMALTQMRPPASVDVWVRTADDDFGDEPFIGDCFCGAPDIRIFEKGTSNEVYELTWGSAYDVQVVVRNLGDDNAANVSVSLKYTLPWAAPSEWTSAHDDGTGAGAACVNIVSVGALDETQVNFIWQPRSGEISDPPAGQTHYCLLVTVNHDDDQDPLDYTTHSAPSGSAWAANIKGTNNCALRNVHIH